jgi:hypothetical protein
MKKDVNVSRDKLENLLENFFDLTDQYDIDVTSQSCTEYVAGKLKIDEDTVTKEYGPIIEAATSFNESAYHNAVEKKFSKADIKNSFAEFYKQKLEESAKLAKEELMEDPDLKIFRKTQGYTSADVTGKYKMLWRYAVREFSKKINDEEELADVCMEIAMYDDQQF